MGAAVAAGVAIRPRARAARSAAAALRAAQREVEARRAVLDAADALRVHPVAAAHDRRAAGLLETVDLHEHELAAVHEHAARAVRRVGTQPAAELQARGDLPGDR